MPVWLTLLYRGQHIESGNKPGRRLAEGSLVSTHQAVGAPSAAPMSECADRRVWRAWCQGPSTCTLPPSFPPSLPQERFKLLERELKIKQAGWICWLTGAGLGAPARWKNIAAVEPRIALRSCLQSLVKAAPS